MDTPSASAEASGEFDVAAEPSRESSTTASSSKESTGKRGARSQQKRRGVPSRSKIIGVQKKRLRQPLLEELDLREEEEEEGDEQETREEEDLSYEPLISKRSAAVSAKLVTRQQLTLGGEPPLPASADGAVKRKSKGAQRRNVLAADIQEAAKKSRPSGTSASTVSQSTVTSAQTLTASLFDLPSGTLGLATSTSEGADSVNAGEDTESAANATAAKETVPEDDDNEPGEPEAADDDELELTGLVEANDRRWMKPPHAMRVRAMEDLSMFVRAKTTAMKVDTSESQTRHQLTGTERVLGQVDAATEQR